MTPAEVGAKLRQFNEWRRGDYEPSEQPEPPNPYEVGLAIDAAVEMIDRLEAAEKERDAMRSLVVMRFDHDHPPQFTQGYDTHELTEPVTAEHCRWFVAEIERLSAEVARIKEVEFPRKVQAVADGWRGKLEAAEKETASWKGLAKQFGNEADALRAKIEQMEQQAPIGTLYDDGCFVWRNGRPHESNYAEWKMPLYALPGAKEKKNER